MTMRLFAAFLSLACLFDTTFAKGKGSSKECADLYCCTSSDETSFSSQFLLNFTTALPVPLCTSTQRQLEVEFVVSYNYLARLNCDRPCFRRATDARIVAAPEDAFVTCDTKPQDGYDGRKLYMSGENTFIIEVDLEQGGACMTALDGKFGEGHAAHPDQFKDACDLPAFGWEFTAPKDVCNDPYNPNAATCCCVCGTERSLSEFDLAHVHRSSHTLTSLGLHLDRVRELFARSDCSPLTVEFSAAVLLEFSGDSSILSDPDNAAELFRIAQGGYNALTFEQCDNLGRSVVDGTLQNVNNRRRLQFSYANSFGSCLSCAGGDWEGIAKCRGDTCPPSDDLDFFGSGITRRRELVEKDKVQELQVTDRGLAYTPITSTTAELITDQCLCPVHAVSTGTAPEPVDFVTRFNEDLAASGMFPELGELLSAIEYETFPSAGPPKDFELWVPIYAQGNPCGLDVYELQAFADLFQDSYNDIVVQECDKPLFRQILSPVTWMDPHLDCAVPNFVVHVKVQLRCHGFCDPHNPLFSVYKDAYRLLTESDTVQAPGPYHSADYHPELDKPKSAAGRTESNQVRGLTNNYEKVPGPDGICFKEGARNPMSPTIEGMENRINGNLPTTDITRIDILTGPLCRCQSPYEYFYGHYPPSKFENFRTQNGIYVVPHKQKPCPTAGIFPCY